MPKEVGSTQQFVEIDNIKGDTVFLKNGGLRKVLMVTGINIELKSEEEQNVVLYSYQNFLNTLDFSIQFVVHSRKLNISGYLEKLSKREGEESNGLIKDQISEYREFIRSFVEDNAVMNKTFFAVVPYDKIKIPTGVKKYMGVFNVFGVGGKAKTNTAEQSEEEAQEQLSQRVDQVINGLSAIGLRSVALNKEELIELFYNLYNPETVEKKELKIAQE